MEPSATKSRRRRAGFSLAELLATVAAIGILAGVSVQSLSGLRESAREAAARDTLALLNRAVLHFNQTNWDLVLNPVPDATSDELAVLRTLQWRHPDPAQATPGSPYAPSTLPATMSSSPNDYRLQWNGRVYELLLPGTSGAGLLVGPETPAPGATPYTYPEDYSPLGPGQHE